MRIAYGKLGRSIPLTLAEASSVGGDIEVIRLLEMLSARHEVHLVGRNRADAQLAGVVNHWDPGGVFYGCPPAGRSRDSQAWKDFRAFLDVGTRQLPKFDAWVIWLGQHGSSLHPVPAVQDGMVGQYTEPLISLVNYGYPLVHMINYHDVRPIWLCPDPRNMVKFRDLWNPNQRAVLAQYDDRKANTFFDERDGVLRRGGTRYLYSGIELLAVPEGDENDASFTPVGRSACGILVNEGPTNGTLPRRELLKKWFTNPEWEIVGHWTPEGMRYMGRSIEPVYVTNVRNTLKRWLATVTLPASSTGWATAKPWECFAAGTICFKHSRYDDQNHIYGQHMPTELRDFLTPWGPKDFEDRVNSLRDERTWLKYASLQLEYLRESRVRLANGYAAIQVDLAFEDALTNPVDFVR